MSLTRNPSRNSIFLSPITVRSPTPKPIRNHRRVQTNPSCLKLHVSRSNALTPSLLSKVSIKNESKVQIIAKKE